MDPEIWPKLAQHWQKNHCAARPGVSEEAIADFEQRYQVVMPADVRTYFQRMDGQCDEMGNDYFRFWPLSEVKPVSDELSENDPDRLGFPGYFVFADYLIWSWGYAVEMGSSSELAGAVYVLGGGEFNRQIASSFVEFIQAYVTDPLSVAV